MKERLRIFPMKVLAAFSLLLMFSPVSLMLGRYFLKDQPTLWYLLPLLATLWGIIGYLLPTKFLRVLFPWLGILLLIAYGIFTLFPQGFLCLLPLVPCIAILLMLPPAWASLPWDEWHPGLWMVSTILHLIAQFMATFPSFSGTAKFLSPLFVVYAFILVMMLNSKGLRNGMHGSQKAPPAMKKRNRALVIALFAPALLASCWGMLADALDRAWAFIRHIIAAIVKWILSLFEREEMIMKGESGGSPQDSFMGMEPAEPSAFALFMEKVLLVVCAVAVAVLLFYFFKILFKKLRILIKKIMERLKKYAASVNEDYVDEAESTLNLDEKTKALKERLQKAFSRQPRQIPWSELDGRARVRRLYQQFLKKKPNLSALTAREALSQDKWMPKEQAKKFTELYEQARYSDHPISAEAADQLKNTIK